MNFKLSEVVHITMAELDAEGPSDVEWLAFTGFSAFFGMVMRSVGTGGLDEFRLLGNTAANGGGTDVELLDYADFGTLASVDAVGDTAMLDADQATCDKANSSESPLLGVSVSLGHVTATDESVITSIRYAAENKYSLLTPQDVIA